MTEAFTEAAFVASIKSAEGTPYRLGGIDPFHGGADCSGLIYWSGLQFGVKLPRTTEAEWAGLPHFTNLATMPVGAIVEFEVPGDGGAPPQHVGVNVGGGFMIDDPHTGTVVKQEAIPDVPGVIWPIGYCLLPFVTIPVVTPTPAPTTEDGMFGELASSKQDDFNATLRHMWNTYRTDPLSAANMQLFWYVYNLPVAQQGCGGSIDVLLANLVDGASKAGKLRAAYSGSV